MTSQPQKTLSSEINLETRSLHTHLNALITSRLPLALPPHAETTDVYLSGLIPFAQTYIAVENAWQEVCVSYKGAVKRGAAGADEYWIDIPLEVHELSTSELGEDVRTHENEEEAFARGDRDTILAALASLRPPGLPRSDRLKRDIAALAGIPLSDVDDLLAAHGTDATRSFAQHVKETVPENPHVLLAHAFVLYMAIFSGGRWIRSILAGPGESFWSQQQKLNAAGSLPGSPSPSGPALEFSVYEKLRTFSLAQQDAFEELGLSFWFFPSLSDGLDIKNEFKRRLVRIERLLTPAMRADVVAEAKIVFVHCETVVSELDEHVGRQGKLVRNRIRAAGLNAAASDTRRRRVGEGEKGMGGRARGLKQRYEQNWWDVPGYAGLALVLSCVSYYAMYHAGVWSA